MKKTTTYRQSKQESLFEEEFTLKALSAMGNPLEQVSALVDFEFFRPTLEKTLLTEDCKTSAGRRPMDVVLMFKVIFLQRYYGLGDHQIEYQIIDRTSFREFLNIHTVSDVPDEKTVWACKNKLVKAGVFDTLFDDFHQLLDAKGLSFNEGKIIDATFVEASRQRNTRGENTAIKNGKGDELWNDNPHKKCHKDIDTRWTKKRDEKHYGYKGHTKVDKKSKLIESYHTTASSTHDSNVISQLITDKDKGQRLYLDAGYEGREDVVKANAMRPVICEKGHRNHPLTKKQKKRNRKKSRRRCRVEHVFGFIEGAMHGSFVRTIGIARAKASFALTCLVYNIFRYCQINKYQPQLLSCKG